MEDLKTPEGSTAPTPMPEAGDDAGDPLRPEVEEEHLEDPPISAPLQDTEVTEDHEGLPDDEADAAELSDNESLLSEVDERQFEDFDPENIDIDERPAIAVDETNVGLIAKHKRKRTEDGEGGTKKKKKEGRREKKGKSRRRRDEEEPFSGGEELEGKRERRKKGLGERREGRRTQVEDTENLTPDERAQRELDRRMDEAVKNPSRRPRKRDGIDLEALADQEIEDMRQRMANAAQADAHARERGKPAMHKLKLLPEVVSLLNRNNIQNSLVDPDVNLLEAVRFFLEPLSDGSLPAYNIQRELFTALAKLPITQESLMASGIGKVVLFYTKSNRPEVGIKRQAERLVTEWTRPILRRTDDYRKKELVEAQYDPTRLPVRSSQMIQSSQQERNALPIASNRARVEGRPASYTIVPKSNLPAHNQFVRAPGHGGEDAFRRMRARQLGKTGGGNRR